eukprot:COSAG05_NODE_1747_length_4151_cov_4.600197_3_plen_184_part_00
MCVWFRTPTRDDSLTLLSPLRSLTRLKRILAKHNDTVDLTGPFRVWMSLFSIVFVAHIMACIWYFLGFQHQVIDRQTLVGGRERTDRKTCSWLLFCLFASVSDSLSLALCLPVCPSLSLSVSTILHWFLILSVLCTHQEAYVVDKDTGERTPRTIIGWVHQDPLWCYADEDGDGKPHPYLHRQ